MRTILGTLTNEKLSTSSFALTLKENANIAGRLSRAGPRKAAGLMEQGCFEGGLGGL